MTATSEAFPIGTPGVPWGEAEKQMWFDTQSVQRSYADDVLTALAERRLVDSTADANDLPSNASVAHRLGWSGKKLDRKPDYLCARLDSEGVRGLRGEKGGEAVDRRSRLVEHVIESGMIRQRDLELLPGDG